MLLRAKFKTHKQTRTQIERDRSRVSDDVQYCNVCSLILLYFSKTAGTILIVFADIGFSVPVKEKEVNVTRVVKPSQQVMIESSCNYER